MELLDKIKAAVASVPGYTLASIEVGPKEVLMEITVEGLNSGWASPVIAAIKTAGLYEIPTAFEWLDTDDSEKGGKRFQAMFSLTPVEGHLRTPPKVETQPSIPAPKPQPLARVPLARVPLNPPNKSLPRVALKEKS